MQGRELEEACEIHRSLSALSHVISELAKDSSQRQHVPFRDCMLTTVLRQPLYSKMAKVLLIAAVSPAEQYLQESRSTLKFADRCAAVDISGSSPRAAGAAALRVRKRTMTFSGAAAIVQASVKPKAVRKALAGGKKVAGASPKDAGLAAGPRSATPPLRGGKGAGKASAAARMKSTF